MQPSFRQFQGTTTYLTDESLEAAVNCALAMQLLGCINGTCSQMTAYPSKET